MMQVSDTSLMANSDLLIFFLLPDTIHDLLRQEEGYENWVNVVHNIVTMHKTLHH
jgi:hypothetical protein